MFNVTYRLKDSKGKYTSKTWQALAATVAAAETAAAALMADVNAVSDLGVQNIDYTSQEVINQAAQAGSYKGKIGVLHCRLDNGKLYPLEIPGIKESVLNSDGSIKIDDVAILAYVANFETAGDFRLSENNYITAIESGELR